MFKSTKKRNEENLIKRLVVIESVARELSNKLKTSNAELKQSFEIFINDLGEYRAALSQGIESTDEVANVIDTLETTLNYAKTLVTRGLTDKDTQKFQKAIAGMSKSLRGEEIQEVMVDDAERSMRGAFIVRQEKTIEQKLAEGLTEADMLALSIKLKGIEIIERENAELKAKAAELEKRAEALASENTHLYKAVEANQSLAKEFMAKHGEVQQDFDDLVETKAKDDEMSLFLLKKQSQVMEDNKRLQGNLDEENQRYLALDAESKAAIEAKKQAEESAAFAHKNLTVVSNDLATNVKARQVAEYDLALRSAQLQRNIEDLKQLTADIIDLAEVAEDLKEEKDKYYTEAQFGYIREKCDLLQRRRGELMERVHTAEKAAKQATLEVGYQDSVQRTHIQKLEAEINQLKAKTLSLQQECAQLKSSDVVIENEQLRAKLKAEREKKFSGVLEQFDNAAAAGVLVLGEKSKAQQARITELETKLAAKDQASTSDLTHSVDQTESRLAKNIKRIAIGAGFVLAGIATVAALGFLGAVAVTYALPLLAIGLVVAAGGTAIAKLIQSKHEEGIALEVAERREAQPGFVQKTALAVKSTLEKAVITVSSDLEKA